MLGFQVGRREKFGYQTERGNPQRSDSQTKKGIGMEVERREKSGY